MTRTAPGGLLLCLLLAASARAGNLELAQAQVKAATFPLAAKTLRLVEEERDLSREQVLAYYELSGVVFASVGEEDRARDAFARLLALAPDFKLKERYGPRVMTPFYEGKALAREQRAPGVVFTAQTSAAGTLSGLTLACERLAAWDAREVVVQLRASGIITARTFPAAPQIKVPVSGLQIEAAATVRNGKGWVLLEVPMRRFRAGAATSADAPPVVAAQVAAPPALTPIPTSTPPSTPTPTPTPTQVEGQGAQSSEVPPLRGVAIGLGVGGGLSAVLAVIAGVHTAGLRTEFDAAPRGAGGVVTGLSREQALALQSQAQQSALATNVALVASGVLLAGAATAWFLGAAAETRVAVVPVSGGGGLVLAGSF